MKSASPAMAAPAMAPLALPPEYDRALTLAQAMLAAAQAGDQAQLDRLRERLPDMARSLARSWQRLNERDPGAARRLESARIRAIRDVIAVDNQIRRIESPALARIGDLIQARRPVSPFAATEMTSA